MKRSVLAISVFFALACSGLTDLVPVTDGATDAAPVDGGDDKDKTVVVVPVPDGGADAWWCCEHGAEGAKKFALVAGPAECNERFGDDQGRWVEGPECTPCCCKTAEVENPSDPWVFELTTPTACAGVDGTCLAGDAEECGGEDPEGDDDDAEKPDRTRPPGQGSRKPAKPGGGGAKRPPAR